MEGWATPVSKFLSSPGANLLAGLLVSWFIVLAAVGMLLVVVERVAP
jgi:hypothetical protein